jgi:hypothetical protein
MQVHLVQLDSLDSQEQQEPRVLQEIQVIEEQSVRPDNRAALETRALLGQQDQREILVPLARPVLEVRPDREELLDYLGRPDLLGLRDRLGLQGLQGPLVDQVHQV